jgi:ketosteroid isomerase-like protein
MTRTAIPLIALLLCAAPAAFTQDSSAAAEIIALERKAMDGWLTGNPDPSLAIADPQITFFHIMLEKRIEGLPALKQLYESYRGTPLFASYEMLDPKVQVSGDVAVLTYQLVQQAAGSSRRWNGTQVFRKGKDGWRVIHTHWSETNPAR